jgi:hypothetical protein
MGSRLSAAIGLAVFWGAPALAHPNGTGPDPDGDGNPAVDSRLFARIGDSAEAALGPPWCIVTFEMRPSILFRRATDDPPGCRLAATAPPGRNDEPIRDQYYPMVGVKFGNGLKRQICEGQRYSGYDTECTYLAAPSGQYAAVYRDDWRRPLRIRFEKPACAAALALYPTGGAEGEEFQITIQPYIDDLTPLAPVKYNFTWTKDTFRWRLMAGALFPEKKASRIDVNIKSLKDEKRIVRFLIDDVAYIEHDEARCGKALADIEADTAGAGS